MKVTGIFLYTVGIPFWLAGLFYGIFSCIFRGGYETAEMLLRRYDESDKP